MVLWIIVMVVLVLIDQATKLAVSRLMLPGNSVDIIPGVFRFTYVQNDGAAFGMLSEHRWVFMVISVIAIVGMLIYLWKFRPKSFVACAAVSMIVAGGIGNMIDRIALGYVIDFIDFCAFPKIWMWVFNVADSCVCVGGGLLVLWLLISIIKDEKAARADRLAGAVKLGASLAGAVKENGASEAEDDVINDDITVEVVIQENEENKDSKENKENKTNEETAGGGE